MKITEEMLYEHAPKAEELWLDSLPLEGELPMHKFSGRFERKMKKLIRVQCRSPRLNKLIHTSRRIALIALTTLTVSFSCLMCVEAYRNKIIEVVTEIFEDLTRFSFSSTVVEVPDLGSIVADYLPDGMMEVYRSDPDAVDRFVYFEDAEGRKIGIEQNIIIDGNQSTLIVDTEDADVTVIDFNGYDATLIVKGESTTLIWEDDVSTILISGDFPPDEIIRIANGVHFYKK